MRRSAALDVAMALMERPAAVRYASTAPLPAGVSFLLQVATAETAALRSAQAMTGQSRTALQAAAGFYIEQILFHPQADSYRTLGVPVGAPRSELRQNMALLIKWLHPDGREQRVSQSDLERGIFIHRVTQAWENLKTDERRVTYDRLLAGRKAQKPPQSGGRSRMRDKAHGKPRQPPPRDASKSKLAKRGRFRRLIVRGFERQSLLSRMFSSLWMRI